jgi:predicted permease
LSPSSALIGMPITANIIQIAKQTVNDNVLAATTEICFVFNEAMLASPSIWRAV